LDRTQSISSGSAAMRAAIADTGPLIALFDRAERHHRWVRDRIGELDSPLLVCEAVLTEAMYLLARLPGAHDGLFQLLEKEALSIAFQMTEHTALLHTLLRKYRDIPMSLADACVVRMAEIYEDHAVFTLDADFAIYRKHDRTPLELIHPPAGRR
jgi:predicted nucleic acid-binding protein